MPDEDIITAEGAENGDGKGTEKSVEEVAREQGWNPDYDGPDKIDAAEFVRRKPLFDKIKSQSKELKEVKKLVEGMANTYKSMSAAQYQKGIKDAEARMKQAKADYDVEAYEAAAQDKATLEKAKESVAAEIPPTDQAEIDAWCDRNPWYDTNKIMRTDALEYREKFIKRNPDATTAEVLEYVENKMRKDYPDAFEEKKETRRTAAPVVESAVSSQHKDPLAKLKASMSAEEKRIMGMFVKNGGLTEAEYLKDYAAVRGDI